MSKENDAFVALMRKLVRQEFWILLEEEVLPLLKDFVGVRLEAERTNQADLLAESLIRILMARSSRGKESLSPAAQERTWNWDPAKIAWSKAQGTKGEYERAQDPNNQDFIQLLKDLSEHQGTLTRDGIFYWTFKDAMIVGKKKREAQS